MVDRMVRAARADVMLYEEVEAAPTLTQEAYTIVGIIAVINAISGLLLGMATNTNPILTAIGQFIGTFAGYFVFAYLAYFIGTRVFGGTANAGEVQRTLGYAYTPQILAGVLLLLGVVPVLGILASCLAIIPALWTLYLGFVAIRQALDIGSGQALLTALLAIIAQVIISAIILSVLGINMMGAAAVTGS
ncbi:MAG: Yip1 family protein [Ardenticatenaceae bacterium]